MGTPAYIAPEVLSRREYDGKVSPEKLKSDEACIGHIGLVIAYMMWIW